MVITIHCLREDKPAEKWQALFNKAWPFYKQWFLSEGVAARKGFLSSENMLRQYMPELMPTYEKLVLLAGGGDLEARFLSMYCPPAYMTGCSQLVSNHGNPFLIRNYDYSPNLFEGNFLYTHWIKPVIGNGDCTWGLLDGMNADGLTASLAFGGRNITGDGFGIPLIIRYLLETSSNVQEALSRIVHIPSHMVYTITLADVSGQYATVYLSPDRAPVITGTASSTNHQQVVEWPEYAAVSATVERQAVLDNIQADSTETEQSIIQKFLLSPLFNFNYQHRFGTIYTVQYQLNHQQVNLYWPQTHTLTQSFSSFNEGLFNVHLPVPLNA